MKLASPLLWIENKSLQKLCTLGIGGTAQFYCEVKTVEALQEALVECNRRQIPFFILGKGSNCLFDDRGFKGCVIHNKIDFIERKSDGIYHIGAGYAFALLGVQTAREGWSGLEFASGIPASLGGAVFMNAGANGQETQDCLTSVDFVDAQGSLHCLPKEQLKFSYRHSPFQDLKGAIAGATFTLKPSSEARSKQLDIVRYRQKTQPYGDKSAGCVFRNPEGKIAGKLIEESGLKEYSIGEAQVSTLHANFLINKANATCEDFKKLIAHVQKSVKEKQGVSLECEIRTIPYE